MAEKFKNIIEQIESLNVLELSELVKVLEEKFNVSASAPTFAVGAPTSPGASVGEEKEEKTSFNVELKSIGEQKIQAIKVLRDTIGLGLKEAKDMVDRAPVVVKEEMDKKSAEELKTKLEAVGCVVELK